MECKNLFGVAVAEEMKEKYSTLVNGKWLRFTFSNLMLISDIELDKFLEQYATAFKNIANKWDNNFIKKVKNKNFF